MNCVLLRWLMLFCVLSGVEQCHLLVLRVAKWTVSMISWKCDYPGKLWVCFELALKKLCYDCCIRSTVSLSCYPLVLMRLTCLAALQNKHTHPFGAVSLVVVVLSLFKTCARCSESYLEQHQKIVFVLDLSQGW